VLSSVPLAIMVAPFIKLRLPVGVTPDPTAETVAVNWTTSPKELGFFELVSVTGGVALLTTWVRLADEPPTKLLFPLKTANNGWSPGVLKLVERALNPEELTGAVPSVLLPSAKITEPDRVPLPGNFGCTVAVRVTGAARLEGLLEEESVRVLAP